MSAEPLEVVLEAFFGTAAVTDVAPLAGGLTNANHAVTTDEGRFVVRRWSDDTGLLAIDRDAEHDASCKAARTGVGAEVVGYRPDLNALVVTFVEGPTMSPQTLAAHLPETAAACRRLHAAEPFRAEFDMFAVQAGYRAVVGERGFRLPDGYDDLAPKVAAVRDAARRPEPRVSCHNDLLAENLLLAPDGLRIVDYEYSGLNEPSFELGNLAAESRLDDVQLTRLVGEYWGEASDAKVARALLWGAMASYGWTLWAFIQDGVSDIDFDFWAWGTEKLDAAAAFLEDDRLDDLLASVG